VPTTDAFGVKKDKIIIREISIPVMALRPQAELDFDSKFTVLFEIYQK